MERLTERTALGICGNNERVEHYPLYNIENEEYMAFGLINQCFEKLASYEDAEEQGLLIRLPVAIGETCWGWEYPTRIDEEDGSTWTICDIRRAKVVPKKFNIFMLDRFGESYFETKEEAEQALAKMKGE